MYSISEHYNIMSDISSSGDIEATSSSLMSSTLHLYQHPSPSYTAAYTCVGDGDSMIEVDLSIVHRNSDDGEENN